MEHNISYDSLLILSIFAFITPFFVKSLKRIKIPYQVGEIFVGILIGTSGLNIIKSDLWIIFLSELGLAYLMFLSGLEIDFSNKNKEGNSKKKQSIIIILMFIFSFIISYLIIGIFNILDLNEGKMFFSLLFTAAAPGLMVPYLKGKDMLNTDFGQSLLIFSLVCEFICLIGITIIASTTMYGFSYKNFLFIILFIAAFLLYLLTKRFYKHFDLWAVNFKNLHIGVRAAFALILILVTLSNKIGSEIILGSFLAGIIVSLISGKAKEELTHKLDIIGYGFLIPIFFIMVGVNLNLKAVFNNTSALGKIPFILLAFFLIKAIPCLLLKYVYGLKKAVASGFILSAQLSLIIVGSQMALNLNLIDDATYGAFILSTIISCIIFPILFEYVLKDNDDISSSKNKAIDRIIIREVIPVNENYLNIPLKNLRFPEDTRVFLVERNGEEIFPSGNTTLKLGDEVILAGLSHAVEETVSLMETIN